MKKYRIQSYFLRLNQLEKNPADRVIDCRINAYAKWKEKYRYTLPNLHEFLTVGIGIVNL
jgi:hypothetical protein